MVSKPAAPSAPVKSLPPQPVLRSVPAPVPPTQPVPKVVPQVQPLPDSKVDPFGDEASNRVRRVPAQAVRYPRLDDQQTPVYGQSFDPQASNAVRVHFSDDSILEEEGLHRSEGLQPVNRYRIERPTIQVVPASSTMLRPVPDVREESQEIPNPLR